MKTKLKTAPTVEPVSLTEIKEFLRLQSGTPADNTSLTQCIFPGDHATAAAYSLKGTGVDVLGYNAVVYLESATNGAGGTVDVKLQESDDDVDGNYTDVASGAFTQVVEANDNATYEKAYTGVKRYLRVVSTVGVATCDFGVTILKESPTAQDDTLLTSLITAARRYVESATRRALITQSWYAYLDEFPTESYITLPFGKLSAVTSVAYIDSDNTTTTMAVTTDYLVDTSSDPGRVVLPYAVTWPSFTAYPINPIVIDFTCGYGAASTSVPSELCTAVKILAGHWYENRDMSIVGQTVMDVPMMVDSLIASYRLWEF